MVTQRIEAKRAAARSRIVEVALKAFVARGFESTTMTGIADQLQMTGPSLYHYFPTKDAMLFACLEQVLDQLLDEVGKAVQKDAPVVERIRSLVRAQVKVELRQDSAAPLINAHLYGPQYLTDVLSQEQREVLRVKQRRIVQVYRDLIEQGIGQGVLAASNPVLAAFNVLAIVQYSSVWYRPRREHKLADVIEYQVQAVMQLLGATGHQQSKEPEEPEES